MLHPNKWMPALLLLTAIIAPIHIQAQDAASGPQLIEKAAANPSSFVIGYEKWRYPNGLTLIIHEDHSDPLVHVEVTYHVGSNRESLGKSGFAHFFEHMMFQGSRNVGDEQHFKIVSESGGTMNGTTNRDRTNYFETVPSNQLETMLWLEADRMGFLLDSVTQKKFENQRATVKNEKSQNQENQPYGMVYEVLCQNLYPYAHPYSWPTIGYVDDLDRADVNDLRNFFMRWYGPNNAILTVAGDVDPEEVKTMVAKYFGPIPKGPDVYPMKTDPVILPVDKYANIQDDVYLPFTIMAFPGPKNYHKDEPAMDLLSQIMGGGNNSIVYRKFVKSEKAIQAVVGNFSGELASEFAIQVVAYPNLTFNEIESLIRECINEFEAEITDDALSRVKANTVSGLVDVMGSVSSKASNLTQWQMLLGDRPFNLNKEIERYEKVTREDLIRVFNKYIKGRQATFVNVAPAPPAVEKDETKSKSVNPYANVEHKEEDQYKDLSYNPPKDNFDRSKRPASGAAKPVTVPSFYNEDLINGLRVIGTQFTEMPKTAILINMDGGHLLEDGKKFRDGTAMLTASILNEGTAVHTTEQISAELDKLGASINFSSSEDGTSIFVETPTKNLDATLKLLDEKLFQPGFKEDDFKRSKKQALESIRNQKSNMSTLSQKAFMKVLYGDDSPLGRFFTGTYDDVDKISLDDVREYYNLYYSPSVARLVVVSDLPQKDVLPKLEFLKKWERKEVQIPQVQKPQLPEGTEIYVLHKDYATASQISIGYPIDPYDALGEHYKKTIMNFALGGAFNSRVNLNLREDKGYTYGARSNFQAGKEPGVFMAGASVKTDVTDESVVEFMKEFKKYRESGITDEELEFTKNSLLQSDARRYETLYQKARFLSNILEYKLPADYTSQQAQILKGMTKDEINKLAKEHLPVDHMVIVIVGNKNRIKKDLEALGYGKVKEIKL
ncbi:MAG: insulinase family protein [Flavobacteriales bacterium]|nr:insulinase family protein [Flavobacteriales bacterium]